MARISIFKGREARLNKAIFWILSKNGPLTIYEIWRALRDQQNFVYIRYHIVNRRVRVLEKLGFTEKTGERRTKTGFMASYYQLTAKAYLAIALDKIDLDDFLARASPDVVLSTLAAFISIS